MHWNQAGVTSHIQRNISETQQINFIRFCIKTEHDDWYLETIFQLTDLQNTALLLAAKKRHNECVEKKYRESPVWLS
jgi:hypothetical protein